MPTPINETVSASIKEAYRVIAYIQQVTQEIYAGSYPTKTLTSYVCQSAQIVSESLVNIDQIVQTNSEIDRGILIMWAMDVLRIHARLGLAVEAYQLAVHGVLERLSPGAAFAAN